MNAASLLRGFSLEVTGRDADALGAPAAALPSGTRVNVTSLGSEEPELRVQAAQRVIELGLRPVPHVAARRLGSRHELREYLSALQAIGASASLFIVGGDPSEPRGPFADALSVIESGELQQAETREVGVAGYPEGHPGIADDVLWNSLEDKVAAIHAAGMRAEIITQFGFDTGPVIRWLIEMRHRGIDVPVRIGTPGPAGVARLVGYARRFGIGANAMIVRKYGFSLANLVGTAGPDRFLARLAGELETASLTRDVTIHLYAFGGPAATASWARDFTSKAASR